MRKFLTLCTFLLLSMAVCMKAQTKRALIIALGQQQDRAWNKINGDKDVPFVIKYLKVAGYRHITTLVNRKATKEEIVKALKRMATSCKPGDVVYIHYSGHGQQMTDIHNDEKDGLDECWIPYDAYRKASASYHGEKHLTDDELNVYLNSIRNKIGAKGKLLVAVDACHSGDSTRGEDDEVVRGVEDTLKVPYKERVVNPHAKPLPERWITISACTSFQKNSEMAKPVVGKLTYALYLELINGKRMSNAELMRRITRFISSKTTNRLQTPELSGEDKYRFYITDILKK